MAMTWGLIRFSLEIGAISGVQLGNRQEKAIKWDMRWVGRSGEMLSRQLTRSLAVFTLVMLHRENYFCDSNAVKNSAVSFSSKGQPASAG